MPEPLALFRAAEPAGLAAAIQSVASNGAQIKVAGSDSLPLLRFDPARQQQPVSTLRMNKVIHHAVADMTVSVQAGISLEALQRQLAWHDQWLPVDPPVIARLGRTPGARTLGGLIASNSLGPLGFGLEGGDWRRLVLGIRWIDAGGTLIKGGGQTVKNVAGYSSPRMLIGSAGSLGVIAEVTLRTFARPADEQAVVCYCRDAAHAEELLAAVFTSDTTPAYVELIGARTFAGNPLQLPAAPEAGPVLVVGFLGRAQTCAAQLDAIRGLAPVRGIESIAQTAAQSGRLRLWIGAEPALAVQAGAGQAGVGVRLQAHSSDGARLLTELERRVPGSWLVAHGQGVISGALPGADAMKLLREIAPDAPLLVTQGESGPIRTDAMQAQLKRTLDPKGVFGA